MATMQELETALINADKAGDEAAARVLASAIQEMRAAEAEGSGFANDLAAANEATSQGQQTHIPQAKPDFSYMRNIPMGALAGATDIGRTLMYPVDATGVTGMTPQQRKQSLETFYAENANPESLAFKGGRLGTQIAGTAGTGSLFARGAQALHAAPKLVSALQSGGFSLGTPQAATLGGKALDMGTRIAGGGLVGGVSAGMIDPESYKTGALLGAIMPPGVLAAGKAGQVTRQGMDKMARALMNSSLKPTIAAHRSGDAAVAVDTLLKYGITPNEKGALKLHAMLDDNANKVAGIIGGSNARINKNDVLSYLDDTRNTFMNQVDPMGDIGTIQQVADNFSNHPYFAGGNTLPIQQAQAMKQGTQHILKKKYGQQGSAEVEASKGLARGLREEIGKAEPAVLPLNEADQKIIRTLDVMERRMLMDLNKNPAGLAVLAGNKAGMMAFLADRSAGFKNLVAKMLYQTQKAAGNVSLSPTASTLLRTTPLAISASP